MEPESWTTGMGLEVTAPRVHLPSVEQPEMRSLSPRYRLALENESLRAALSAAEVARDAFATEARDFRAALVEANFERDSLRAEVERLKAELAWVTETELGLAKQKQNLNRAKLQAAYDALAEHCQTAKHPSPLLLAELQSMYRLLEDPA